MDAKLHKNNKKKEEDTQTTTNKYALSYFLYPNTTIYDCFHFGNSRVCVKFSFCKNIFQVLTYSRNTTPKELCHSLLGTPKRFILDNYLHLTVGIRHVVEKKLYFVTHVTPFNLKKH